MALFRRRKQQNDVLPDEVKDYYRAEQRDRIGGAWLMAFGGFLLTVAIVLGLFFAGRWAYQAIFVNDNDETVDVIEEVDEDKDEIGVNGLPDVVDDDETGVNGVDVDDDEERSAESDSDTDIDATTTPPVIDTSDERTGLPRTGPVVE